MLRFSGSSQNPGSSVLDELQLSNGLLWKAGEDVQQHFSFTMIFSAYRFDVTSLKYT